VKLLQEDANEQDAAALKESSSLKRGVDGEGPVLTIFGSKLTKARKAEAHRKKQDLKKTNKKSRDNEDADLGEGSGKNPRKNSRGGGGQGDDKGDREGGGKNNKKGGGAAEEEEMAEEEQLAEKEEAVEEEERAEGGEMEKAQKEDGKKGNAVDSETQDEAQDQAGSAKTPKKRKRSRKRHGGKVVLAKKSGKEKADDKQGSFNMVEPKKVVKQMTDDKDARNPESSDDSDTEGASQ